VLLAAVGCFWVLLGAEEKFIGERGERKEVNL
jgi:hypothetical protein